MRVDNTSTLSGNNGTFDMVTAAKRTIVNAGVMVSNEIGGCPKVAWCVVFREGPDRLIVERLLNFGYDSVSGGARKTDN